MLHRSICTERCWGEFFLFHPKDDRDNTNLAIIVEPFIFATNVTCHRYFDIIIRHWGYQHSKSFPCHVIITDCTEFCVANNNCWFLCSKVDLGCFLFSWREYHYHSPAFKRHLKVTSEDMLVDIVSRASWGVCVCVYTNVLAICTGISALLQLL